MLYQNLFCELNSLNCRYLIVGGFAAILHGVPRATFDLDLVIDFENGNITHFLDTMIKLEYQAQVPVNLRELAQSERRKNWFETKNMKVFSFVNRKNPMKIVGVLIDPALSFFSFWDLRVSKKLGSTNVNCINHKGLIELKKAAGRAKDLEDLKYLESLYE